MSNPFALPSYELSFEVNPHIISIYGLPIVTLKPSIICKVLDEPKPKIPYNMGQYWLDFWMKN